MTFDLDKGRKDLDYLFRRKLFRRVFDSFLLVENEMLIDLIFWLYSIVSDKIISLFKAVVANRCIEKIRIAKILQKYLIFIDILTLHRSRCFLLTNFLKR